MVLSNYCLTLALILISKFVIIIVLNYFFYGLTLKCYDEKYAFGVNLYLLLKLTHKVMVAFVHIERRHWSYS